MRPVESIPVSPLSSGPARPEAPAVLEQLERLLANPHIRNSKRCYALLKHIVEQAASGSLDGLKERTLGAEVFHREPDYDTNQDSVVRTTAAEIRKRLAQYYLEPGHEHELRVSLPSGSYVPEFRAATLVTGPALAAVTDKKKPNLRYLEILVSVAVLAAALWLAPQFTRTPLDRLWQPALADKSELVICPESQRIEEHKRTLLRLGRRDGSHSR
jgi:hypothetical protein